MAYRETMENNGMEAGRAKNQIPYCTVVLVALNVILFLIGLILTKAGEWMESEGDVDDFIFYGETETVSSR